jgi:hypothetical protein
MNYTLLTVGTSEFNCPHCELNSSHHEQTSAHCGLKFCSLGARLLSLIKVGNVYHPTILFLGPKFCPGVFYPEAFAKGGSAREMITYLVWQPL